MIRVENISKHYKEGETVTKALKGATFSIEKGEFVSIMGPSGSGKSTLLHLLSFLDRPTSGSYRFNGKDVNDLSDKELAAIRNKGMGFIFQSFNLLSRSSVYENVEMPLLYSPVAARERAGRVLSAIEAVGLGDKVLSEAGNLSGGQKQRVAIARALVNDPDVIFADEPTGNLDSSSGAQVMDILRRLNEGGRTIILVTHETYTAEFGKRLIRLKDGEVELDQPISAKRSSKDQFFK